MKKIIVLLLFPILVYSQENTGVVQGKIIDDKTGEGYSGAFISLKDNLRTMTDEEGYFEITNVPYGKYILVCSGLFNYLKDTVTVSSENDTIFKKYFFKGFTKARMPVPDSVKEYHNLFSNLKESEILEIFIDSTDKNYDSVYVTFRNKTEYPVYLIEDLICFPTITFQFIDENSNILESSIPNLGCDIVQSYLPRKENLIKLNSKESLSYVLPLLILDSYKSIPNFTGKYLLNIVYSVPQYEYVPLRTVETEDEIYKNYKEEIEVLNLAVKGVYTSINEMEVIR